MNNFNILLVDDIQENLYSLEILIKENFNVNILTALNAKEAIKLLLNNDIDLILTDVQMPDVNGFELIEYIKTIDSLKDIPVIFITGIYYKKEYLSTGYNLGAIEYISKPIDDKLLKSKLNIYINLFEKKRFQENEIKRTNNLLIYQSKFIAMGEMISMIAHQWRQPLTTLSLILDRMNLLNEMNKLDKIKFKDNYSRSSELIQHMSKTIDDFRDFYNFDEEKGNFYFEEILNKSLELIKPLLDERSINLDIVLDDKSKNMILNLNLSKISQVFLNIYINALDEFEEKKTKNAYVKISSICNENFFIIDIEDNAGGIPEEILDKIFDPYFSTKNGNGTGIGLYMSKMIIEQHMSGSIEVFNKSNGACFRITLPL